MITTHSREKAIGQWLCLNRTSPSKTQKNADDLNLDSPWNSPCKTQRNVVDFTSYTQVSSCKQFGEFLSTEVCLFFIPHKISRQLSCTFEMCWLMMMSCWDSPASNLVTITDWRAMLAERQKRVLKYYVYTHELHSIVFAHTGSGLCWMFMPMPRQTGGQLAAAPLR